jgi:hypothetical protein
MEQATVAASDAAKPAAHSVSPPPAAAAQAGGERPSSSHSPSGRTIPTPRRQAASAMGRQGGVEGGAGGGGEGEGDRPPGIADEIYRKFTRPQPWTVCQIGENLVRGRGCWAWTGELGCKFCSPLFCSWRY